jgi:hypothetical protein
VLRRVVELPEVSVQHLDGAPAVMHKAVTGFGGVSLLAERGVGHYWHSPERPAGQSYSLTFLQLISWRFGETMTCTFPAAVLLST